MERKKLVYGWTAFVLLFFILFLIHPAEWTFAGVGVACASSIFPIAGLARMKVRNLFPEKEGVDYSREMEGDFKEEIGNGGEGKDA